MIPSRYCGDNKKTARTSGGAGRRLERNLSRPRRLTTGQHHEPLVRRRDDDDDDRNEKERRNRSVDVVVHDESARIANRLDSSRKCVSRQLSAHDTRVREEPELRISRKDFLEASRKCYQGEPR